MEINNTDILLQVADTFTGKTDTLTYKITPRNWLHKKLMEYGLQPKQKSYTLTHFKVGNMYRVSKALLKVPSGFLLFGSDTHVKELHTLVADHLEDIAYVVAIAITNSKEEPPRSLIEEIKWQFDVDQLLAFCSYLSKRGDTKNFLNSIVSIRGLDVLSQTSPKEPGEIIAPGV